MELGDFSAIEGYLRQALPKYPRAQHLVAASESVILGCLGPGSVQRLVADFGSSPHEDGTLKWPSVARICHTGAYLFELRAAPGFQEICRRLRSRDMRAAFYELATANYLRMGGCTVDARPEIKVKGADYDLTAIREGQHFAVEVTALAAEEFSPSTLLNALNNKRKQLPKELPSIIFCVMPETWLAGIRDWSADTSATMVSFIRNTRRVNAVVLLKEEHVTAPGGYSGALALSAQPVFSLRPRVELDMDFLKIGPSGEPLDQGPFGGLVGEDVDPSEFFEWVRSLAPS